MVTLSVLSLIIAMLIAGAAAFKLLESRFNLIAASLFFYFLSLVLAGNLISH